MIGNDPLYGPQSVAYNVWVASGDATMLYRVVGIDPSLPDDDDADDDDDDGDDDGDDDDPRKIFGRKFFGRNFSSKKKRR